MLLTTGDTLALGVGSEPRLKFGEATKDEGSWAGRRLLYVDQAPAFELSYWCGTCPFLFERLEGANTTLSISEMQHRLAAGLDGLDSEVIGEFGRLLAHDDYVPMLLEAKPTLVRPGDADDYFCHEQVATWGITGFWGLPHYPRAFYYRTYECAVDPGAHLFEFVVPMVPPSWNEPAHVDTYRERLRTSASPTVIVVSTLDVCRPAVADDTYDDFEHWCLTHFVLDGHHKLEAAATEHRSLRILSLLSRGASLASSDQLAHIPQIRSRPRTVRSSSSDHRVGSPPTHERDPQPPSE
jgi:hypothetical protein